ncbi:nucleotidyltransferase family protein [Pseudomonas sp.]|uniref:nucleotidyltransferase family protein n=1 Tax=Pseudomonas sp. TaxID=306 RepID=UPI003D6DCA60
MLFTDVVIEQAEGAPIPSARRAVTAVVLAAGLSRRMGRENKLLLPISGEPLIRFVVRAALQARCHRVLVVLGHEAQSVRRALVDLPVDFVFNETFEEGIGSSVRVGANAVSDQDAVVFCLADMPSIRASVIDQLIDAFEENPGFMGFQASYGGKCGNPVLWAPGCLPLLRESAGDEGARPLLRQYSKAVMSVNVGVSSVIDDIDTPEDYSRVSNG